MTWSQFKDLLPLIGVALGYAAGFLTTWFNDRRQYDRERVRWIVEQQAGTLAQLADVLRDLIEQTQVVMERKREVMGRGTTWPEFVEGMTEHWVLTSRARVVLHRVADDVLREKVAQLVNEMERSLGRRTSSDAMLAAYSLMRRWGEIDEEIGVSLRNLYPEEARGLRLG